MAESGADYIDFYVGNARQAAYYCRAAFGMTLVGYAGPETGRGIGVLSPRAGKDRKIRFVLTTSLDPDHPIAEHIELHGDGGRDIAVVVDDA